MTVGACRAALRLTALVGLTAGLLAAYAAAHGETARRRIVRAWHRGALRILGLRIRAHGALAPQGALLVANHVSYLDVLALGALSDAAFVAKADVAGWPVVGFLARLADTLFVERTARRCGGQIEALGRTLEAGRSLVLFAEGTSTPGRTVLPFKSALFAAARGAVQPITLAYAKDAHGRDLPIDQRGIHPWVGEDALVPHLWTLLQHPGATVDVIFHAPVAAEAFASRKALAEQCRDVCARGLVAARRRTPLPHADESDEALGFPIFGVLR